MRATSVEDCVIMDLPKIHNPAGNITAINNLKEIPFSIKRVYYLYDVPGGEGRGGHSHKELQQLIVAVSGSFDITFGDGVKEKKFSMSRPNQGLYAPPGLWRVLDNFSAGAVCLVLASTVYSADDYIRDFALFKEYKSL